MKKGIRRGLGIGASSIVLFLIFYHLGRSAEWREFRWQQLWWMVAHARRGPLFLAVVAVSLTYLVRAYRWKVFLAPIKEIALWLSFKGQILGFSSIYLVGRAGEFVRPAYIARKAKVSFTPMAAVWLLERVFDCAFLILLFAAALSLARTHPTSTRGEKLILELHKAGRALLVLTALAVASLVLFRLRAEQVTARLSSIFPFLPAQARQRLEHFLRSFADGLEVIRNWKDFLICGLLTTVLWSVNTAVFWLAFQSLDRGLEQLSWMAAGLAMICAGLGLVIQFPGIGGGYQVGTILALTQLFSVRPETATGGGILVWMLMSLPCVALGVVLLILEGLTFRKLGEIAAGEREAVVGKL